MSTYHRIIERVFSERFRPGDVEVGFLRQDLVDAAVALGLSVPKNLGDVLYTFRSRRTFPKSVPDTAPADKQWSIRGAGQGAYKFRLVTVSRIVPNPALMTIKIRTPPRRSCQPTLCRTNRLSSRRSGTTVCSISSWACPPIRSKTT